MITKKPMALFYFSIGLAITSSVLYHIFQRSTSATVNPALAFIITYIVSLVICLILLLFLPLKDGLAAELRKLNWASFALALALVGLEVGFLLAYRSGWDLGNAAVMSNVSAAILLVPLGVLLFHERPTFINLVGVVVCIIGLILINRK